MNKIWQHSELTDTFLVGNHCHIFRKIPNEMQLTFHKALTNTIQKMDLYPAMVIVL